MGYFNQIITQIAQMLCLSDAKNFALVLCTKQGSHFNVKSIITLNYEVITFRVVDNSLITLYLDSLSHSALQEVTDEIMEDIKIFEIELLDENAINLLKHIYTEKGGTL